MNSAEIFDVVIIGAGLGGITLAREMNNKNILLIDKAKSVGGRAATRRLGEFPVNHGLNGFIVTDPKLSSLVEIGLKHNLLESRNSKVFATTSINAWMKLLAQELKVKKETKVTCFKKNNDLIEVYDERGSQVAVCRYLVITTPAFQAQAILEESGFPSSFLEKVKYSTLVRHYLLLNSEINHSHLNLYEKIDSQKFLYKLDIHSPVSESMNMMSREEIDGFLRSLLKVEASQILDSYTHRWLYSEVETPIDIDFQGHYSSQGIHLLGDYFSLTGVNELMKSVDRVINSIDAES